MITVKFLVNISHFKLKLLRQFVLAAIHYYIYTHTHSQKEKKIILHCTILCVHLFVPLVYICYLERCISYTFKALSLK